MAVLRFSKNILKSAVVSRSWVISWLPTQWWYLFDDDGYPSNSLELLVQAFSPLPSSSTVSTCQILTVSIIFFCLKMWLIKGYVRHSSYPTKMLSKIHSIWPLSKWDLLDLRVMIIDCTELQLHLLAKLTVINMYLKMAVGQITKRYFHYITHTVPFPFGFLSF